MTRILRAPVMWGDIRAPNADLSKGDSVFPSSLHPTLALLEKPAPRRTFAFYDLSECRA